MVDVDDSIELERLKKALGYTLEKNPKISVVAVSGHQVNAPGRPSEVKGEILEYMKGRKPKTAHQIARAIQRTDRSVYKPLHELLKAGVMEKKRHPKYPAFQWNIVEG